MPFTSPLPIPRLGALATAVPPFELLQDDVAQRAAAAFGPDQGGFSRWARIYENAQINSRHSCMSLDWFEEDHSFGERNALYLEHGVRLLTNAASAALAQAGLEPRDIDVIVTISSSGIATPALDARVMGHLGFRPDVQRMPIFGLGCAGGVMGLARAAAMAQVAPDSHVLLLVVELCTLTFRKQDRSKSNIVATALFGDGAAAAVITCRANAQLDNAPSLGPWGEHTWPDSLDVMGWDVAEDGLKVIFSRDIPALVRQDLRDVVDTFLDRNGLAFEEIDEFICHPGGAKVLEALEGCFDLQPGALRHARNTLRDHGNMSAVTVLFVLRAALDERPAGRALLTTLGPGFSAAMMMVGCR